MLQMQMKQSPGENPNALNILGHMLQGQQTLLQNAPKNPEKDQQGQPPEGSLDQFLINY